MRINAYDENQDLEQYFNRAIEFIHHARVVESGNVLVHW